MERVYRETLPERLAHRLLLDLAVPGPQPARHRHARRCPMHRCFMQYLPGYAGLAGAYARHLTGRPYVVTEHGIYTNERRIELSVADWIFDIPARAVLLSGDRPAELREFWLKGFIGFSRVAYAAADVITTQYRANQDYQRADGAPERQAPHHPERHRRRCLCLGREEHSSRGRPPR